MGGRKQFSKGKIYYYVTLYVYYFYTELLVIRDTICLPLKPLRNTIRLISKGKIYYYAKVEALPVSKGTLDGWQ